MNESAPRCPRCQVPMIATSREPQRVEVMNRAAVPETLRPILHIWQCPNCSIARPRFD